MRIRWTEPAASDLIQICDYIEEHNSKNTARRVALAIFNRVSALSEFPSRGREGRKVGTRELAITGLPYLAVYRLHDDTVELLRILHGAQEHR
jgi:addiction module RelE/StbE family toxin